ncbi:hypothetical protein vseg_018196 [Gypsophila vaccaria]
MKAVGNGKSVECTTEEFGNSLVVPCFGETVLVGHKYDDRCPSEVLALKRSFSPYVCSGSQLSPPHLNPQERFFFNFLYNTLVPRRCGRQRFFSYESVILRKMLNGVHFSLLALVFSHIESVVGSVAKGLKSMVLPYGMWLSKMLESLGVVDFKALSNASKGEIGDEIFPLMKLTLQDFAAPEDSGFGSPAKGECSAGNDQTAAETVGQ